MVRSKTAQDNPGLENDAAKARTNGSIFLIAALDMSWRLAIVVLVPIIGGFELDKATGTAPALTILGFILAMFGLYAILKRTLATADEKFRPKNQKVGSSSKEPRR